MPTRRKIKSNRKVFWRGQPLRIPVSVEDRYRQAIEAALEEMQRHVRAEIVKLFKSEAAAEHFAGDSVGMDASVSSQARILTNALKRKFSASFGDLAQNETSKMTDDVNRASYASVSSSMRGAPNLKDKAKTFTLDVKKLDTKTLEKLKAAANRSANFIRTIPNRYIDQLSDKLFSSIATEDGLQSFQEFLEKHDTGIKNWVKNTAMDQTRKAYNGLNAGRVANLGITQGEWIHSGGSQHPRPLHVAFDGQVFSLAKGAPVGDDGEDVMPGEEPNCRCTFGPVLAAEENASGGADTEEED